MPPASAWAAGRIRTSGTPAAGASMHRRIRHSRGRRRQSRDRRRRRRTARSRGDRSRNQSPARGCRRGAASWRARCRRLVCRTRASCRHAPAGSRRRRQRRFGRRAQERRGVYVRRRRASRRRESHQCRPATAGASGRCLLRRPPPPRSFRPGPSPPGRSRRSRVRRCAHVVERLARIAARRAARRSALRYGVDDRRRAVGGPTAKPMDSTRGRTSLNGQAEDVDPGRPSPRLRGCRQREGPPRRRREVRSAYSRVGAAAPSSRASQ